MWRDEGGCLSCGAQLWARVPDRAISVMAHSAAECWYERGMRCVRGASVLLKGPLKCCNVIMWTVPHPDLRSNSLKCSCSLLSVSGAAMSFPKGGWRWWWWCALKSSERTSSVLIVLIVFASLLLVGGVKLRHSTDENLYRELYSYIWWWWWCCGGICNWASACIKLMLIWITGLIETKLKHNHTCVHMVWVFGLTSMPRRVHLAQTCLSC